MSEGRFAGVVILAEDRLQARFIRSWLKDRIHIEERDIRDSLPDVPGRGAGEQFVRNRFPYEAESHRKNSAKRGSLLLAVIDADTGDVADHYNELMQQAPTRGGVFIFVPKRSIETWLHQLTGNPANEEVSYKMQYKKDAPVREAGKEFLRRVQDNSTAEVVPSLARGIEEAIRIPRRHDSRFA